MSTAVADAPTTTNLGVKSAEPAKPDLPSLITVTPKAASEVKRIMAEQAAGGTEEKLYLRVRVVGGGCSGFQHKLDLDPTVNEKLDETFETHGIGVVVDKRAAAYKGAEGILPFPAEPGIFFFGVDLRGFAGEFMSLDYGNNGDHASPVPYVGESIDLEAVGLHPMRTFQGWRRAPPAPAGARR